MYGHVYINPFFPSAPFLYLSVGCTSTCNWTRTNNHLVHKRTLNHLVRLTLWPLWLNGWMYGFVYELSGCRFESKCCHLNFRFCACLEQGVPWHLGNYRVWIHFERYMWRDKNIQCMSTCLKTNVQKLVTKILSSKYAAPKMKNSFKENFIFFCFSFLSF